MLRQQRIPASMAVVEALCPDERGRCNEKKAEQKRADGQFNLP
jgi:hypothetical protein